MPCWGILGIFKWEWFLQKKGLTGFLLVGKLLLKICSDGGMVDTRDLKSLGGNPVKVRVLFRAS